MQAQHVRYRAGLFTQRAPLSLNAKRRQKVQCRRDGQPAAVVARALPVKSICTKQVKRDFQVISVKVTVTYGKRHETVLYWKASQLNQQLKAFLETRLSLGRLFPGFVRRFLSMGKRIW